MADVKQAVLESSTESTIYVGCDSKRHTKGRGKFTASYATVVVIHWDGCHGGALFGNIVKEPDFGNMRMRLMNEVYKVVELAGELEDIIAGRHIECHLDLNPDPKHESNTVIGEALGYVRAMGFVGKIKPEGWAASSAADHLVHNLKH